MGWIVLAGALVPLLLLGLYLALRKPAASGPHELRKVAAGKAIVGEQLKWRLLSRGGLFGGDASGGLAVGNFDSDADEELLLVGEQRSRIYNADGSSSAVSLHGALFMSGLTAWDYDGNGIDDIVPDPLLVLASGAGMTVDVATSQTVAQTPVYALSGSKLADLPGTALWSRYPLVGDLAGEGYRVILLDKSNTINTTYGKRGTPLRGIPVRHARGRLIALADVDGSGRASLVTRENRGRSLLAFDRLNKSRALGSLPLLPEDCQVTASDVNLDGFTDLIFGAHGYFNIKAGWIPFQHKQARQSEVAPVAAGVLGNGQRQIAVISGPAGAGGAEGQPPPASDLLLFDKGGQLVHHARFGREISGLARLRTASGKEHICLQFSDRLLIYP